MVGLQEFRAALEGVLLVQVRNEKRRGLWWDNDPPRIEVDEIEECLHWAMRGGIRSAFLAFCGRASFNILLVLLKIRFLSVGSFFVAIRHAIAGKSTLRFSMMLGSFIATYKFLLNTLHLLSRQLSDKRSERRLHWHATVAGAVAGGLAVLFESCERRLMVAQQAFVRGLQGAWGTYSTKNNIHFPHGDVLLFVLFVSQIGYAWEGRQDTLPPWYSRWYVVTSLLLGTPNLLPTRLPDVEDINELLELPNLTPKNSTRLEQYGNLFLSNSSLPNLEDTNTYIPPYVPCAAIHPTDTSCASSTALRVLSVGKGVVPLYAVVHFLLPLLFSRPVISKDPVGFLVNAGLRTGRSVAFLGVMIALYQVGHCGKHQLYEFLSGYHTNSNSPSLGFLIPKSFLDSVLTSKSSYYIPGILAGLSVLVEEKHRREELAMYVFPKALESVWLTVGLGGRVPPLCGEVVLAVLGMGMVMNTYQNKPKRLSGLVRKVLYQFVGPN
ncbi:hypothetical protein L218DRAFT_876674 [Marasmius fiardii PR-910]|nr:hypothetical protein L218DRAFT_876674 [Marasmius fiardii PR-910]